jgi:hypothetical protein
VRFDPSGKRALFETPVTAAPDHLGPGHRREGRDALFSIGPPGPGMVLVTCAGCSGRARVSIAELGLRMLTGSIWMPGRRHDYWMRCPACERRQWCNVTWRETAAT